jgi:hypothetical protein
MGDRFQGNTGDLDDPGWDAFAVTPSNSTNFSYTARALYIGSVGDVTVVTANGGVVTFVAVPTGTGATSIVGIT